MKTVIILALIAVTACFGYSFREKTQEFQDGDIIFQTSKSSQSQMIKIVTGSDLTHCGLIFKRNGKLMVFEAVDPVKVTSLENWINRGRGGNYKVARIKGGITAEQLKSMKNYAYSQLGKRYDLKFQWSDSKMYCSELVWKTYFSAGIQLCEPNKFSDYDLNSKIAKKAIQKRYGRSINLNEKVVTPVDVYDSWKLNVIYSTY